ncbi:MAG: SRPBCC domain-containing protein [Bacteroidota bacterium]
MSDLAGRTVTIEKVFDAPLELVWKAWTESEHIVKWWAPIGAELKVIEHDFRAGGKWKYTMPMPDGSKFVTEGTYKEIIAFEKIVTSADFRPMTENVELQVSFAKQGDQTKFTFRVVHETVDYRKQQEKMGIYNGWGSAFERLEKVLGAF